MRVRGIRGAFALLLVSALAACGGGGGFSSDGGGFDDGGDGGDGGGDNGGVGPVAALVLSSAQPQILADGESTAVLSAVVRDADGNGVDGETVTFSTTAGTLSETSASTDSSGIATIRLTSSTIVGRATVTARHPDTAISATASVDFIAANTSRLIFSLSPSSVRPDKPATVSVQALDSNGNPIANEAVRFDNVQNESGGIFSDVQVSTDVNGRALTTYTAGSSSGVDTLRGQTAGGLFATADLTISASAVLAGSLELTTGADSLVADGASTVALRATVTDTEGAAVSGLIVSFSASAGSLSASSSITNSDGVAQVVLRAGTIAGSVTVTASAAGYSATSALDFVPADASVITLSVAPTSIAPGANASVLAVVADENGNRVPGETISFSTSGSGRLSSTTVATNSNGEAMTTFTSSGTGAQTIQARMANGVSANASIDVSTAAATISAVNISSGAATIAAGGSTTVLRATVVTDAGAISGIPVNFGTTLGTLSALSAMTNASGVAQVTLQSSSRVGTATVTASSGGFSSNVQVAFTAGVPSAVAVSLAPSTVAPNRTTTVVARVTDANGNAVGNQRVDFSAPGGAGSFASTGTNAASAVTSADGVAQLAYTPDGSPTSVPLTVTTASGVSGTATLSVDPAAESVTDIVLTPGADEVPVGGSTTLRATISGDSGPLSGVSVSFASTLGILSADSATTNASGIAEVTLNATDTIGTATVRAFAGGKSDQATVGFVAGAASRVELSASPVVVPIGGTSIVQASVLDADGNPVSGTTVLFDLPTDNSGATLASTSVVTDANGRATTSYTAGSNTFTAVTDTVRARVASLTAKSIDIAVTVQLGMLDVQPANDSIVANGTDSTTLIATVFDSNGAPVSNAPVMFRTSAGTLSPADATTDPSGTATVRLQSPTAIGSAAITATVPGLSASTSVQFLPGEPDSVSLSPSPGAVVIGGSTTLTATILDANANPVSDEQLLFSIVGNNTGGTLVSATATTDGNGRATVAYQTGPTAGTDTINVATAGGKNGTATVVSSAANALVAQLTLNLGTDSIAAGDGDVAVDALVADPAGNPVTGASVIFTTTAGSLSSTTATTDATGRARVQLTPPNFATTLSIRAAVAGISDEDQLQVVPAAADAGHSSITANPTTLLSDGVSTTTVTVVLNDRFDNPLPDGRTVRLLTTAGAFVSGNTAILASGRASLELRSPSSPGTATISVQDLPGLSTEVSFESASTGDPASIRFVVVDPSLSVAGVGQNDQTSITVTVLDSAGNVIDESLYGNGSLNNLQARFVTRPGGGEAIAGRDADGTVISSGTSDTLDVRTRDGVAVLTLLSGTASGIVEIEFSVLDFDGTSISARASLPQVSIAGGPPHTIVFSGPITGAVENLDNGNYRLIGKVDVTDRYGNAVPDGTVVNFAVMDSVMMHDNTGDKTAGAPQLNRSGTSLIRRRCTTEPLPDGEATGCSAPSLQADASDFTSPILRNGTDRTIQTGDLVLLRNATTNDKRRLVDNVDSATQLSAQQNYMTSESGREMFVGASLLGVQIFGLDEEGGLTPGTGIVKEGIAELRLAYPANVRTILTGCYGYPFVDRAYSDRDRRGTVPQSRQVITVASAGSNAIAIDQEQFCFKAIAGATLSPSPATVVLGGGGSATVDLLLRDGGDTIPLPYTGLGCFVSEVSRDDNSDFSVAADVLGNSDGDSATGVSGHGSVRISVSGMNIVNGDQATVNCVGLDASASITVSAP